MYNINYNAIIESILVPDKRNKKIVGFNNALVGEVSNNNEILFNKYKDYTIASIWTAGTYAKNDFVKYGKNIFQSVKSGNTSEPTFSNDWRLVSENFLGSDFRLAIRGEKLNLEYAFNIWFGSNFRQPNVGTSDIYLTTNNFITVPVFRVGNTEFTSTPVSSSTSDQFIVNSYSFLTQYNLTINFPSALFLTLGATTEIRNSVVKSFADKYINAGLTYKIQTY